MSFSQHQEILCMNFVACVLECVQTFSWLHRFLAVQKSATQDSWFSSYGKEYGQHTGPEQVFKVHKKKVKLIHTFRFVLNEEIHSMKSSSLLSSLLTRTISSGGAAGCPCTNYFLRNTTLKSKLTFLQGYSWKSLEHPSKFVTFFKSCTHIVITEKDDTKVSAEKITIF